MSVVLKNDAIFPRSPAISIFNQIWKNHTQISYLIKVQLWATRQLDLTQLNAIDALYCTTTLVLYRGRPLTLNLIKRTQTTKTQLTVLLLP